MGNPQFRYLTVENVEIILGGVGVVFRGEISVILHSFFVESYQF